MTPDVSDTDIALARRRIEDGEPLNWSECSVPVDLDQSADPRVLCTNPRLLLSCDVVRDALWRAVLGRTDGDSQPSGRLSLSASGTGGLLEMKSKIAGSTCFGFFRLEVSGRPRFVLINYISETISGVPRGKPFSDRPNFGRFIRS